MPSGLITLAAAILLLAALQALPTAWHAALRYDRDALLGGEVWRLFTGHLIHLSWAHWALNAVGLVLCCALAESMPSPEQLLRRVAVLGLGVSLMLLVFSPQVSNYVGLSGVLYGLFVLVLWPQARRGEPIGVAALCIVIAWMAWQMIAGPMASEMELIGGRIVTQAHLFGVLTAMALFAARALLHARGAIRGSRAQT